MSRIDCINNRIIKIISDYVKNKTGNYLELFKDLPYPEDRFRGAEDFFLNEDEWTTFDNFITILRRGKELVGERYFYFNCGASSAYLNSWGRFEYFERIFTGPNDAFKRIPFFNKNFVDTKDIELILPPTIDSETQKIMTILKIKYHPDIDPNYDYIGERFTCGIISSIPTIWGLLPAEIKVPVRAFDPLVLFEKEPEFSIYGLKPKMEGNFLTLIDPEDGKRKIVGQRVRLIPERVGNGEIFKGKFAIIKEEVGRKDPSLAFRINRTIRADEHTIIVKEGEIYDAPYFILEIYYSKLSWLDRVKQIFRFKKESEIPAKALIDTIDKLRESIEARNEAYYELQRINNELIIAKDKLERYNKDLERIVQERTAQLTRLNSRLQDEINRQLNRIKRFEELRRYLSPKIADEILRKGEVLGAKPKRRLITVVFTDIRNFSSISESIEPEELFHLMDQYMKEMIEIIHRYDGTLNKIIGDGMMIFFGDPVPIEDHAERAVLMALEMRERVGVLKKDWIQFGHELSIGIGINTGYMTVGNIGSETLRDYTVLGNQVNVAARLVNIAGPGQILISQRTMTRVRDMVESEEMGDISVKGLQYPVKVYNVIGKRKKLSYS